MKLILMVNYMFLSITFKIKEIYIYEHFNFVIDAFDNPIQDNYKHKVFIIVILTKVGLLHVLFCKLLRMVRLRQFSLIITTSWNISHQSTFSNLITMGIIKAWPTRFAWPYYIVVLLLQTCHCFIITDMPQALQ